jgi:DNA-binding NarL/FixJ family response regulator
VTTSVVIVDAPSVHRNTIARGLSRDAGMHVTLCDDAAAFAAETPDRPADIALVAMELIDGITSLPPMRRAARYHHLVAWRVGRDPAAAVTAIRHGAVGVVDRQAPIAGLVRTLRAVAGGQSSFPRDLSSAIVQELQSVHRRNEAQAHIASLSRREREVLSLIAKGYRNASVAEELGISKPTAKRHVHNILEKLGVPTRSAAARFALDARDDLHLARAPEVEDVPATVGRSAMAAR